MTVVLEDRPGEAQTPAGMDASLQPAAAAYSPVGNPRSLLSGWMTSTRPVRRPFGMGDDLCRGQTEGWVVTHYMYCCIHDHDQYLCGRFRLSAAVW